MVQKRVRKRYVPAPKSTPNKMGGGFFVSFFSFLLLPFVYILTKIGEITIISLSWFWQKLTSLFSVRKGRKKKDRYTLWKFGDPISGTKTLFASAKPKHELSKKMFKIIYRYKIPFRFKLRYFFLGAFCAFIFFIPLIFRIWLSELPNPSQLAFREPPLTTKIYDRNGKILFQIYANQNRTNVPLADIPQNLINATIAIEDKNFYRHPGFDIQGIMRAARETLINNNLQGGSTITQQLIKSSLLTPETTLSRKTKELVLAFWAEKLYTKQQILEMYFNQVPYGGTAWGIEAASEIYFGKNVKDLDLAQSAVLAGLPSAPTTYSPFGQPELTKRRQIEVLDQMVTLGYITPEEADKAKEETLVYAQPSIDIHAPHFVWYVKDLLVQRYGLRMVEQGGLQVYTTLDENIQQQAQNIVTSEVQRLSGLQVSNGAALITNPQTGEILAMIGSADYYDAAHDGAVNATTSLRQPGSSIKVVTYAAALEKGLTAATLIDDSPITYSTAGAPSYSPVNYDGRFHGKVTLREALGNSYNVPAVKTLAQIGLPSMITMGKRLGVTSWDEQENRFGLSLTLGAGEVKMTDLATVYGVLAARGNRHNLTPFLKITNSKGEILEEIRDTGIPVLSESIAFILSDILADNSARSSAFGPNSVLNIAGKRISVKTGTTDSKRDNWTIGFGKDVLVAVWVGNFDNSPMNPSLTSGITGAAPIWNKLMTTMLANNRSDETAVVPSDVTAMAVCKYNGYLPCGGCPGRTEYFVTGSEPKQACKPDTITPPVAIGGAEVSPTRNP